MIKFDFQIPMKKTFVKNYTKLHNNISHLKAELVEHQAYFPDLAPSDY